MLCSCKPATYLDLLPPSRKGAFRVRCPFHPVICPSALLPSRSILSVPWARAQPPDRAQEAVNVALVNLQPLLHSTHTLFSKPRSCRVYGRFRDMYQCCITMDKRENRKDMTGSGWEPRGDCDHGVHTQQGLAARTCLF